MRNLFTSAPAPRSRLSPIVTRHRWLTWSEQARNTLHQLSAELPYLPKPSLDYFAKGEYGYTIVWDVREHLSSRLRQKLDSAVWAFHRLRTESSLILFDKLMDRKIDGNTMRSLFAYVRSSLVAATGNPKVAIYAPLGAAGASEQGDFPLHADLYAPVFLLNVFDQVPLDGSGASLFLPMKALLHMIDKLPSMPTKIKQRFRELIMRPSEADHYEEFYDLLHGEHPWTDGLEHAMAKETLRIPLSRGQGYLVHDRHWLHGRERPTGYVRKDRLHRLIFDTDRTLKLRLVKTRPPGAATARFIASHPSQ